MKKKIISILIVFMFFVCATNAHADSDNVFSGMGAKLWRGIVNTATGWIELPAQTMKGYKYGYLGNENHKVGGVLLGMLTGVVHATGRTLSGAFDIAGFWAADHPDNDGVGTPLDAEYAWEEGTPYNHFAPSYEEATLGPWSNKLLRGAGDSLGGFLEFPGQIMKGIKNKSYDLGIIKGLWYWYSRQVDGIANVSTFFLPNPPDTKGAAFDEKWPWSAFGDSFSSDK